MAKELTSRQREVLDFILESIRDRGYPPTILEICEAFGISSTNGANDHLLALERKGYIERLPKARGIHVTETAAPGLYRSEVGVLPLVGRVAAGTPLLAEQNIEAQIPVSAELARREAYCLRVSGDSMIEDGILDGDIIVVDRSRSVRAGDIVVALVGEEEATVKRYYRRGDQIELRPANSSMAPMRFHARDVQLQGVVVALQRTLN